ncbi:hypothetical protein OPV22_003517 [Ensete ventricosum]|uniref:NAC domain-containing protein n=1 Tax=Ensete ventricosum TaxID=4639 RepID=A0AAV8S128_ENSVE|nr:hypothetical protein OPV22_003517 [Ensete ventricosum]
MWREKGRVMEGGEDDVPLPGFRFRPTDEEIVGFYLRRKVEEKPLSAEVIKEMDIYKYDPWDLPKGTSAGCEEYFFCRRGRKYRNSIRPNRVTGSGFWKATGVDRPIYAADNSGDCIGLKKSLVFYSRGRSAPAKGTKTEWMMHEFRLPCDSPCTQEAEVWTICRVFKRSVSHTTNPNSWKASDHTDQTPPANDFQGGQWNSTNQASMTLCCDTVQSPSMNEFFSGDDNWDELGRIMNSMVSNI